MRHILPLNYAALRRLAFTPRLLSLWGIALALCLVAYPSMTRDFWSDEIYTVSYTAHASPADLLEDVWKNEETPPLYFLAAWLWSRPFGQGEVAMRGLSLLCGTLATLGFASIARRRLSPGAAFVAVTLFAIAPLLQRYMVEARGYTFTLLLAVICVEAYERLWRFPDSRRAQVAYTLAAAALVASSYFSLALLGAQWLLWLGQLREPGLRGRRLRDWGLMHLGALALVLPLLPGLAYQIRVAPSVTIDWSNGWQDYFFLIFSPVMGALPRSQWFIAWQLAGAATFLLIAASALRLRTGEGGLALRADEGGLSLRADKGGLSLRALWLPASLIVLLAATMHLVAARYMIVLLPGAALSAGIGFAALRERRPPLAWLLAALAAVTIVPYLIAGAWWDTASPNPWRRLSAVVAQQADPAGDVVLFQPPWNQRVFEHYYAGAPLPLLGAHNYDDFYLYEGHTFDRAWFDDEAIARTQLYRRVWVFFVGNNGSRAPLNLPYRQIDHWRAGYVELTLYEVAGP